MPGSSRNRVGRRLAGARSGVPSQRNASANSWKLAFGAVVFLLLSIATNEFFPRTGYKTNKKRDTYISPPHTPTIDATQEEIAAHGESGAFVSHYTGQQEPAQFEKDWPENRCYLLEKAKEVVQDPSRCKPIICAGAIVAMEGVITDVGVLNCTVDTVTAAIELLVSYNRHENHWVRELAAGALLKASSVKVLRIFMNASGVTQALLGAIHSEKNRGKMSSSWASSVAWTFANLASGAGSAETVSQDWAVESILKWSSRESNQTMEAGAWMLYNLASSDHFLSLTKIPGAKLITPMVSMLFNGTLSTRVAAAWALNELARDAGNCILIPGIFGPVELSNLVEDVDPVWLEPAIRLWTRVCTACPGASTSRCDSEGKAIDNLQYHMAFSPVPQVRKSALWSLRNLALDPKFIEDLEVSGRPLVGRLLNKTAHGQVDNGEIVIAVGALRNLASSRPILFQIVNNQGVDRLIDLLSGTRTFAVREAVMGFLACTLRRHTGERWILVRFVNAGLVTAILDFTPGVQLDGKGLDDALLLLTAMIDIPAAHEKLQGLRGVEFAFRAIAQNYSTSINLEGRGLLSEIFRKTGYFAIPVDIDKHRVMGVLYGMLQHSGIAKTCHVLAVLSTVDGHDRNTILIENGVEATVQTLLNLLLSKDTSLRINSIVILRDLLLHKQVGIKGLALPLVEWGLLKALHKRTVVDERDEAHDFLLHLFKGCTVDVYPEIATNIAEIQNDQDMLFLFTDLVKKTDPRNMKALGILAKAFVIMVLHPREDSDKHFWNQHNETSKTVAETASRFWNEGPAHTRGVYCQIALALVRSCVHGTGTPHPSSVPDELCEAASMIDFLGLDSELDTVLSEIDDGDWALRGCASRLAVDFLSYPLKDAANYSQTFLNGGVLERILNVGMLAPSRTRMDVMTALTSLALTDSIPFHRRNLPVLDMALKTLRDDFHHYNPDWTQWIEPDYRFKVKLHTAAVKLLLALAGDEAFKSRLRHIRGVETIKEAMKYYNNQPVPTTEQLHNLNGFQSAMEVGDRQHEDEDYTDIEYNSDVFVIRWTEYPGWYGDIKEEVVELLDLLDRLARLVMLRPRAPVHETIELYR